jgi:hypothetical protein
MKNRTPMRDLTFAAVVNARRAVKWKGALCGYVIWAQEHAQRLGIIFG